MAAKNKGPILSCWPYLDARGTQQVGLFYIRRAGGFADTATWPLQRTLNPTLILHVAQLYLIVMVADMVSYLLKT